MIEKSYERQYGAVAPFPFRNAVAIASGKEWFVDFKTDTPATRKYLPFDHIRVTNNSGEADALIVTGASLKSEKQSGIWVVTLKNYLV